MAMKRMFLSGDIVTINQKSRKAFRGRHGVVTGETGWNRDDYRIEFTDGRLPSFEYFRAGELTKAPSSTMTASIQANAADDFSPITDR